jgi:hypothetical protein
MTPNYFGRSTEFEVVDRDITDINIKATRGATVSGTLSIGRDLDKKTLDFLQTLRFFVVSIPSQFGTTATVKGFSVGPDLTFYVDGLCPGKLNLSLNASAAESTPFRILLVDRLDEPQTQPIELKPGDRITDLKVILVDATGGIHGSVKLANGQLPENLRGMVSLYRERKPIAEFD